VEGMDTEKEFFWEMLKRIFVILTIVFVFGLLFILSAKLIFAQDMQFISYEEVEDCKYPSQKIEVIDENGQKAYIVEQDASCADDEVKQ
jgi:hypothetical protein